MLYLQLFLATCFASSLITKPVGQVGSTNSIHYISSRETQLHRVVSFVANGAKGNLEAFTVSSPEFASETLEVLKDWIVYLDTENFSVSEVNPAERVALQTRVEQLVRASAFYRGLEFSQSEIKALVLRHLTAQSFVQFKRKGVPAPTDNDVQMYFDENRAKFQPETFAAVRDKIKVVLTREWTDKRLAEWYQALIHKYNARSFLQDL